MNRMIMIVSEGYGKSLFGVAQVLIRLAARLSSGSFDYKILVAKCRDSEEVDSGRVREVPAWPVTGNFRWHPSQENFVLKEIKNSMPTVIHVHGVFTFIQRNAVKSALRCGIPVLLSPHGMLEPWLWKQNGLAGYLLKRVYWVIMLRPVLKQVSYIHAITDEEALTLKKEFPGIPQVRISNAVDLREYTVEQYSPNPDRYLLFLGRIHPKKGVDLLIKAFSYTSKRHPEFSLVIAGPSFSSGYTETLQNMASNLGLRDKIRFVGPVHGVEKDELLRRAWCTVVPSYSDVVALVNLESAASFTPTITTTMTGLSNWGDGGGVIVEPELEPLVDAMNVVCNWSLEERMYAGKRSRAFVENNYSWDVIGKQWMAAYQMISENRGVR